MQILILCTGNTCRSQMAQGFLKSFDDKLEVLSAGTEPGSEINKTAVKVMHEVGIDIKNNKPQNVRRYLNDEWDYVITVCDDANEKCPFFQGKVKHRLHFGFEDPSKFEGTEIQVMSEFRRIRDEIKSVFYKLYNDIKI